MICVCEYIRRAPQNPVWMTRSIAPTNGTRGDIQTVETILYTSDITEKGAAKMSSQVASCCGNLPFHKHLHLKACVAFFRNL